MSRSPEVTSRCPYCNKPQGSLGILNAHIHEKHPERGLGLKRMQNRAAEYTCADQPVALGAKERGECGWCEAGRDRFFGCCGRTLPHHHTLVVLHDAVMNRRQSAWVRQRTVRIIASDDCPDLPESAE